MKHHYFAFIAGIFLLVSCDNKGKPAYDSLPEEEYTAKKVRDTIINTPALLVTCTGDASHYNDMGTILVRKAVKDSYRYFKLGTDVYFQDPATLIEYQGFFSSGEDGAFQKDGIWVYTDFYKNGMYSGANFAVDSLPPGYNDSNRPKAEGIYRYGSSRLRRVSPGQSEEEFYKLGEDGFYFIPNSGRFFKRHSVNVLE